MGLLSLHVLLTGHTLDLPVCSVFPGCVFGGGGGELINSLFFANPHSLRVSFVLEKEARLEYHIVSAATN